MKPTALRVLAMLLATAGTLAGCASTQPTTQTRAPAPRDTDALAAAALGAWGTIKDGPRALEMISRATEREPARADLAWLHVRLCMEVRSCEPEALESRLHRIDPHNGLVWLGPLARAQARGNRQGQEQILAKMAEATRFDLYWTKLVSRLTPARRQTLGEGTPAPLTTAMNQVTGTLSRIALPAFRALTAECSPARAQSNATTAAHCERIAEAMQRSDTTLVEGIGLGIAQRLATPGTRAAAGLEERIAKLDHLSATAASIVQAQLEREKLSAELLELMRKLPREQDVSRTILRWAGEKE